MNTPTFAGFTQDEWTAAFARGMGLDDAREVAQQLFTAIEGVPSNGYSIPSESWAWLACVSSRGHQRVEAAIRHYPDAFRSEVWAIVAQEEESDRHRRDSSSAP